MLNLWRFGVRYLGAPEGTAPAWHKGYKDNWAEPTDKRVDHMDGRPIVLPLDILRIHSI